MALVVAESQAQAEAAAKLVAIDYEPLPVVTDPSASMQRDAPRLHPNPFPYPYGERDVQSNVLLAYRIQHGDVNAGFAEADVIVESTYRTHAQEHAYLQPEAGLAFVRPDGRIEVICGGQWMHEEREQIAHALGGDAERIVVRYPAIGGAFGGREDVSVQIVLALAAWKTGRPLRSCGPRGEHRRAPQATPLHDLGGGDAKGASSPRRWTRQAMLTPMPTPARRCWATPCWLASAQPTSQTCWSTPHGLHQQLPQRRSPGFGGPQGHFAAEMQVNKLAKRWAWTRWNCACATSGARARLPTRSALPHGLHRASGAGGGCAAWRLAA